ncbi:MAG: hypothetical protein J6Y03_04180 [Alphaproteobacteria bacterium]|nr:hypothetical protein [Alphaproteobacteria bacterium]
MLPIFNRRGFAEDTEESYILGELILWLVVPFIPLYLSLGNPPVFYVILFGYVVFFLVMNIFVMHYSLLESCIFLLFFLFAVFFIKSLFDYEVVNGREIVKNGIMVNFVQE